MSSSKRGLLRSSLILLASLYGCSSASAPTPYVAGAPHARIAHGEGYVDFSLVGLPATTRAGRNVRRLEISFAGNRRPAEISVDGTSCGACGVGLNVPAKISVFTVDTFDKHDKRLSHTSIVPDLRGGPVAWLSLSSTVAGVSIAADVSRPAYGTKATTTLYVSGISDGEPGGIVVGPGAFSQPIKLSESGLTGMRLSKTAIGSATDAPATLDYPGGLQSAFVTARSAGSSASLIVAPLVSVTDVSLPTMVHQGGLAAAGNYVWANLGASIERIDILHGTKRLTPLPAAGAAPGPMAATADGALWYAACEPAPKGGFGTTGIGSIAAGGAIRLFASAAMPQLQCATLALAPAGSIWFTDGSHLTSMSTAGAFTTVAVTPHRTIRSTLSNLVYAKDDTLWSITSYPSNPGSLVHLNPSGAIFAHYGQKFVAAATDGRDRIFAFQFNTISAYDLSGVLRATYTVPTPPASELVYSVRTVTPDGALWFSLGGDADGYALIGRIAPDGSMSELAVPQDQNGFYGPGISALSATADGSVWFPGSSAPKVYRIKL